MNDHLIKSALVGLAILGVFGTAVAQQPQLEEATFYVT